MPNDIEGLALRYLNYLVNKTLNARTVENNLIIQRMHFFFFSIFTKHFFLALYTCKQQQLQSRSQQNLSGRSRHARI